MWNSLPSSVVSSKTIEEFEAQIKIIDSDICVLHAAAQLLVNSFNGPSRLFSHLLNSKFSHPPHLR